MFGRSAKVWSCRERVNACALQTGQNSIAPENSLPQLGQVRWGSVLMGLTALQPHSEPKATPRSTEWCEIDRRPLANDGLGSIVIPLWSN